MSVRILEGDCREVLPTLPAASVHCVVTSPPYWGLRDYGTATWEGGDAACAHLNGQLVSNKSTLRLDGRAHLGPYDGEKAVTAGMPFREVCGKCGARRIDAQLGLEPTPDEYVARMVGVFRDVRRVLRADGTLWLNMGDGYTSGDFTRQGNPRNVPQLPNDWEGTALGNRGRAGHARAIKRDLGQLKPKDLVGMPWRLAFALQADDYLGNIRREADRAWLAALVDGEGCITILETSSSHGSGNSYPPVLQVRMCDVECIQKAASITGYGTASPRQEPPSQGGQRASYQWRLNGRKAADTVAEIYPFLLIKRKQAVIAWNHQQVRESYETKRGVTIPRAALEKQQASRELIRRLNRREAVDVPSWMVEPPLPVGPGWYLRSDCIWAKPNPMPESVTDRPTKAHEYIFLLSKSARYFYDADAVREPAVVPERAIRATCRSTTASSMRAGCAAGRCRMRGTAARSGRFPARPFPRRILPPSPLRWRRAASRRGRARRAAALRAGRRGRGRRSIRQFGAT